MTPALTVGMALAAAIAVALWSGPQRVLGLGRRAMPGGSVPARWLGALRRLARRRSRRDNEVRVVVAQVTALVRAGAPPGAAWTKATGVAVDSLGVPDARGLTALVGDEPARAVAAATRLALTVGAPLGRVLDAVSASLSDAAEAAGEREAALAGPRTTARVLLWLPVVGAGVGWTLGADPLGTATDGGLGTFATGGGLIFLVVGRWWTARLVAAARAAGQEAS
jgi:tight adherence protein B